MTDVANPPASRTVGRTRPRRDGAAPGGPRLIANFLPVTFAGQDIACGRLPYESDDQLAALRARLAETHVVLRREGDSLLTFPLHSEGEVLGNPETVSLARGDAGIATRLLADALARLLTDPGHYRLRRRVPPQFVSRQAGKDLLQAASPQPSVAWLHVHPEYRLEPRTSGPTNGPGLLVGLKTRYEIDVPAAELAARGLDLRGRYVLAPLDGPADFPGQDPAFRRALAGVVTAVRGDLLLIDTPRGQSEVPADAVWLEARRENFDELLDIALGGTSAPTRRRLQQEVFKLLGPAGRLERTREIASWLAGRGPIPLAAGLTATIGMPAGDSVADPPIRARRLEDPTFVFDFAGERTDRYVDRGLTEFGPYDAEGFTPKVPRIAVVTPREYQGRAETFMTRFLNGVPGSKAYPQGFVRKYRLTDARVRMCPFDGAPLDAAAYRRACLDALATRTARISQLFSSTRRKRASSAIRVPTSSPSRCS